MKQTKEAKKTAWVLVLNTILASTLYFLLPQIGFPYMHIVYLVAGGVLVLWYVIYNRGFTRYRVSPEALPNSLSPAEKQALIADGERRFRASRWALTILIPILLSFLFDSVYLFIFPLLEGIFS